MRAQAGILAISLAVLLAGVASLTILLVGAASAEDAQVDHAMPENCIGAMFHHGHGNEMMTPYENAERIHHVDMAEHDNQTRHAMHKHHMNAMSNRENCDEMMMSSRNATSGHHMGPMFHRKNIDGMMVPHENAMIGHQANMVENRKTAGCDGHSH